MKIPDAHPQMVSNKCSSFQKNPCAHFLQHAWNKSCPQTGDRQQTDGQTDRQCKSNIPSPKVSLRGYKNIYINYKILQDSIFIRKRSKSVSARPADRVPVVLQSEYLNLSWLEKSNSIPLSLHDIYWTLWTLPQSREDDFLRNTSLLLIFLRNYLPLGWGHAITISCLLTIQMLHTKFG